jgi:hypothetical protein
MPRATAAAIAAALWLACSDVQVRRLPWDTPAVSAVMRDVHSDSNMELDAVAVSCLQ